MKKNDQTSLAQFLTYRLHTLNKLSERGVAERLLAKLGITLPEARLISAVGAFGPISVMELAHHANLDKSQASRAASALMDSGLLQRAPSEVDGRVVLVSLSTAGRALYRKIMPLSRKWNDDLFGGLSSNERAAFGRMLDRVIEHARSGAGAKKKAAKRSE